MILRPTFLKAGVIAAMVFLTSACVGGRSPSVQFYNLSATASPAATPTDSGPAIAVGPVVFPRSLRRPQIVIRTGPNSTTLDEFHRWSGSLESDFLDTLGADLGTLLDTERVAVYPAEAWFPIDYRLALQVERFDGSPGGTLVLSVRWTIKGEGAAEGSKTGHSVIDEPVAGDTVDDLVRAHDAAVRKFAMEIAERIRSM